MNVDWRVARTLFWAGALGVLLPSVAGAQGRASDPLEELYRLSGLERQLPLIGPQAMARVEAVGGRLSPRQMTILKRTLETSLAAPALERRVLNHLRAGADPELSQRALEWYRSPLGTRITELEVAASAVEAVQDFEAYVGSLASAMPPPSRIEAASRFDSLTKGTESALEVGAAVALATAVALDSVRASAVGIDVLRRRIDRQMEQTRPRLSQELLLQTLYMYRDLSDEELARYMEFLGSEPGRWFNGLATRALVEAIRTAMEDTL